VSDSLDVAWIALSLVPHIGTKTLTNLLAQVGSPEAVIHAPIDTLLKVRGIGKKTAQRIAAIDLASAERAIEQWQKVGVRILTLQADTYPPLLKQLDDAPLTLFVYGNLERLFPLPAIAIVGTRIASREARIQATRLAVFAVHQGYSVVSGLALGIDTAAHQGALSINMTPSIAVLGGGVQTIYPPQNKGLAEQIADHGALISENAPNATATASRLVIRNRIISGLCQHIIVVESAADGGAMHAARAAVKQGRTLHTLDLPASGNQKLIAQGVNILNPQNPHLPLPDISSE